MIHYAITIQIITILYYNKTQTKNKNTNFLKDSKNVIKGFSIRMGRC